MAQVDFYVLAQASDVTRLRLACRIAERAFVPHELLRPGGGQPEAPVLLSSDELPDDIADLKFDLLLNLRSDAVPGPERFTGIAEVLDADPARRTAGTHNLATDTDLPAAS